MSVQAAAGLGRRHGKGVSWFGFELDLPAYKQNFARVGTEAAKGRRKGKLFAVAESALA